MLLNCIIVDDEPLAREGLANYVREVDFLQLAGSCEHPLELISLMEQNPVELIFLDIQMPKMSGIDFLRLMQNPPMIIITTAYPSYALEGFQLNVMDYLLKPITFERFFKAACKARDYYKLLQRPALAEPGKAGTQDYFFIKCGNKYEKIFFDDILYVEGMQNYVSIYTDKGKYITMLSLGSLADKLDEGAFIRVHKSFIAAISKIDGIEGNELFIRHNRIPISRNFRQQVMERVLSKNLWDKK
jgi:two-component system LytT family response regulator